MSECPECGAEIALNNPEVGEIAECNDCGVALEVRGLEPLKFEVAPQEDEDWGE